jgi:hypothetical protein
MLNQYYEEVDFIKELSKKLDINFLEIGNLKYNFRYLKIILKGLMTLKT